MPDAITLQCDGGHAGSKTSHTTRRVAELLARDSVDRDDHRSARPGRLEAHEAVLVGVLRVHDVRSEVGERRGQHPYLPSVQGGIAESSRLRQVPNRNALDLGALLPLETPDEREHRKIEARPGSEPGEEVRERGLDPHRGVPGAMWKGSDEGDPH